MPKPFNQQLHDDILLLKTFANAKGTPQYKKLFESIMKIHGISKATVYNELAKDKPGFYKDYEPKGRSVNISRKEVDTVNMLLKKGKTIDFIKKFMKVELGFSYSSLRLKKVKQIINSAGKVIKVIKPNPAQTEAEHRYTGNDPAKPSPAEPVEFKGNIRKFFYRLSHIEKISDDRTIKIDIKGNVFDVHKSIVESFFNTLAASGETGGKSKDEILRLYIETVLFNKTYKFSKGIYIAPGELKQLEYIRKSLAQTSQVKADNSSKGGYNLDDIMDAVCHFSPKTSREDVVRFIKGRSIK